MKIDKNSFGEIDGKEIYEFTLHNSNGIKVGILNYGGIITKLLCPDKNGNVEDIVLGYDTLKEYVSDDLYIGATVGRFCNRIQKGKFEIDGVKYSLATNNPPNHLHGGIHGFNKKIWDFNIDFNSNALILSYFSKDGEEGYPGNLEVKVEFKLTEDNELVINYHANTDKSTHINLTNHSYFNLSACKENVYNHNMKIEADLYTPTDETSIPKGELEQVNDTPLDFISNKRVGEDIDKLERGYDNNYVLRGELNALKKAATLSHLISGRSIETFTTEPGMQFYTSGFFDGRTGKDNVVYAPFMGACMETQHFPDSPNKKEFPTTLLKPGENFNSTTIYKLSW